MVFLSQHHPGPGRAYSPNDLRLDHRWQLAGPEEGYTPLDEHPGGDNVPICEGSPQGSVVYSHAVGVR